MGSISVRSRENGLERSSGDVQTGDGSSALLSSQLGGQDGEVKVVKMTEPEGHRCSKDKTRVILHSHADYICFALLHSVLSNVSSN